MDEGMERKTEEQRRKPKRGREAAMMMMGLYDVKVLMGISAAGPKEQSRCMHVCVRVTGIVCVCV